jgi:hypothetical protein
MLQAGFEPPQLVICTGKYDIPKVYFMCANILKVWVQIFVALKKCGCFCITTHIKMVTLLTIYCQNYLLIIAGHEWPKWQCICHRNLQLQCSIRTVHKNLFFLA